MGLKHVFPPNLSYLIQFLSLFLQYLLLPLPYHRIGQLWYKASYIHFSSIGQIQFFMWIILRPSLYTWLFLSQHLLLLHFLLCPYCFWFVKGILHTPFYTNRIGSPFSENLVHHGFSGEFCKVTMSIFDKSMTFLTIEVNILNFAPWWEKLIYDSNHVSYRSLRISGQGNIRN